MLVLGIFKFTALFTVEVVALIFSVFLLAYVYKQELGKWFKWGAAAITGLIVMLMFCSVLAGAMKCVHNCGQNGHKRGAFKQFHKQGGQSFHFNKHKCGDFKGHAGEGDHSKCCKGDKKEGCSKAEQKACKNKEGLEGHPGKCPNKDKDVDMSLEKHPNVKKESTVTKEVTKE